MAVALVGLGLAGCAASTAGPTVGYLQQAQQATRTHDRTAALTALNGAESSWLLADAARGNPIVHHDRPEIRAIGHARTSVQQARWEDAAHYISSALSALGGPNQG